MSLGKPQKIAASCVLFVGFMIGAAYASVPLYDWFCRVTGFDGTPAVATADVLPGLEVGEREVTIRFDANVVPGLPWEFEPEERTKTVRVGELAQVNYIVKNKASYDTVGTSSFMVAPTQSGGYFTKIDCFCFQAQPMAAGEERKMAVVFYVDPSFAEDPHASGTNVLTLSYTFYELKGAQG
ncbi:MAG: cytochrome c oxidase assembly protein [Pseudomonadota bacterium]